MILTIVRHGKAERDSSTGRDEDRELKPRGRRQAEWLGSRLASEYAAPDAILSSGLARARQTARILREALGCPLDLVAALETGRAASEVVALVERRATASGLVLVGHLPQLAEVVALLTEGLGAPESDLRTGEACILEVDAEGGLIGRATELARLRLEDEEGD